MSILDVIADHARERVAADVRRVPREAMAARAHEVAQAELAGASAVKDAGVASAVQGAAGATQGASFAFPFYEALARPGLSFICEAKKASPSKGVIAEEFPYVDIARDYERAGAAAISCLTEPRWFLGSDAYLEQIAASVSVPVLRKDFVVDEYMVYQARVLGASAVLLICSILDDAQLRAFGQLAHELGMSALVEAHDEREVERALECGARIVGVNNRNLHDFSVDFGNARRLRALIPADVLYVAESGVSGPEDAAAIARMGADAALVGEALMRAEDRVATLAAFQAAAADALAEGEADTGVSAAVAAAPEACSFVAADVLAEGGELS